MRGIYITNQNISESYSGVAKKIRMQVKGFNQLGLNIEIHSFSDNTIKDKIVRRIPFLKRSFDKKFDELISNEVIMMNVKYVYIRHPMSTIYLINILKKLKKKGIYIVYEFPTYPYDRNSNRLSVLLEILKDKFSRNYLHKYIDLGVNYSGFDEIFKIPCLNLANGIDLEMIPIRSIKEHDKTVRFIGVSLLTRWNGYDRLIKAIRFYNENVREKMLDKPKVEFYIAGEGEVFEELKTMITEYNLEDYVYLCGFISGKELEELYNYCDIGVGTLNPSRKYKNHIMSSLKTKEYVAKGLPIIKGDIDPVFDNKHPDFIYDVLDDESSLDLDNIINWYLDLKKRYGVDTLTRSIRDFASENLSWNKQLLPVVKKIEKYCK